MKVYLVAYDADSFHAIGYEQYGTEGIQPLSIINLGLIVSIWASLGIDFEIGENNITFPIASLMHHTRKSSAKTLQTG